MKSRGNKLKMPLSRTCLWTPSENPNWTSIRTSESQSTELGMFLATTMPSQTRKLISTVCRQIIPEPLAIWWRRKTSSNLQGSMQPWEKSSIKQSMRKIFKRCVNSLGLCSIFGTETCSLNTWKLCRTLSHIPLKRRSLNLKLGTKASRLKPQLTHYLKKTTIIHSKIKLARRTSLLSTKKKSWESRS